MQQQINGLRDCPSEPMLRPRNETRSHHSSARCRIGRRKRSIACRIRMRCGRAAAELCQRHTQQKCCTDGRAEQQQPPSRVEKRGHAACVIAACSTHGAETKEAPESMVAVSFEVDFLIHVTSAAAAMPTKIEANSGPRSGLEGAMDINKWRRNPSKEQVHFVTRYRNHHQPVDANVWNICFDLD